VSQHDVDGLIEAYDQALQVFVNGDPRPVSELYSRRDDVTLANPLGPPHHGWKAVEAAIEQAAANFKSGGSVRIDEVSRFLTPDLAYVVRLERTEAQLSASGETARISLRVTMIFRREEDTWTVAHRHADPITTARPITTAIET
jgi:uncharacterized protein (TIGR02246 family)